MPASQRGPKPTLDALFGFQGEFFSGDPEAVGRSSATKKPWHRWFHNNGPALHRVVYFISESARLAGNGEDGIPTRSSNWLAIAMRDIFPFTLEAVRVIRRNGCRLVLTWLLRNPQKPACAGGGVKAALLDGCFGKK